MSDQLFTEEFLNFDNTQERKLLYEGKTKKVFSLAKNQNLAVIHYKDTITAGNNAKRSEFHGKGVIANYTTAHIMNEIQRTLGINTHVIKVLNMREQLVRRAYMIPVEVVVRNVSAGSLCKRVGIEEGIMLGNSILETYYKSDELGDPLVTDEHILTFDWLKSFELEEVKIMALRINDFLRGFFASAGITLIDLKLEFGFFDEKIILIDEISPDTCRLWDTKTKEKMDKDRFRNDLGSVVEYYREVAVRLGLVKETS